MLALTDLELNRLIYLVQVPPRIVHFVTADRPIGMEGQRYVHIPAAHPSALLSVRPFVHV